MTLGISIGLPCTQACGVKESYVMKSEAPGGPAFVPAITV